HPFFAQQSYRPHHRTSRCFATMTHADPPAWPPPLWDFPNSLLLQSFSLGQVLFLSRVRTQGYSQVAQRRAGDAVLGMLKGLADPPPRGPPFMVFFPSPASLADLLREPLAGWEGQQPSGFPSRAYATACSSDMARPSAQGRPSPPAPRERGRECDRA